MRPLFALAPRLAALLLGFAVAFAVPQDPPPASFAGGGAEPNPDVARALETMSAALDLGTLPLGTPPPVSVKLGPQKFTGATLGKYDTWDGLPGFEPFWQADGVEFQGAGPALTILEPIQLTPTSRTDWTVGVTWDADRVRFANLTIRGGQRSGLFGGLTSAPTTEYRPLTLELVNVRILGPTKWLGFSYQTNVIARGVLFEGPTIEHAWYHHGWGGRGSSFSGCTFRNISGECVKGTRRPAIGNGKHAKIDGVPFGTADNFVLVLNCHMSEFGAGVVLQGAQVHCLISQSIILSTRADGFRHPCVGTEQGGEYFTADGVLGTGAKSEYGNGVLVIEDSILYAAQPGKVMLSISSCLAVVIRRCAIYGAPGSYVNINHSGSVLIEGCNTPELEAEAKKYGVDTTHAPRVQGQVNGAISDRLIGCDETRVWELAA